MNADMIKQVTNEEIRTAIFSIHPHKDIGSDGFAGVFFQKCWDVIGNDIYSIVQNFLKDGTLPNKLNHTLVTLIPRVQQVKSTKDLRSIGLCRVAYKII